MTSIQMSELHKLSVKDKIEVVQSLWDDIAKEQSIEDLPESHKKILDERILIIADFFQVDVSTIDRYLNTNETGLKHNGYVLSKDKQLKEFKLQFLHLINEAKNTPQLGLFNFRSFLNFAMLLKESNNAQLLRSKMIKEVALSSKRQSSSGECPPPLREPSRVAAA